MTTTADSMNYVVATVKPWNIDAFQRRTPRLAGHWRLIDSADGLTEEIIRELSPRYVFFPHWSWRVPAAVLDAAECVCFHMTDVPYGRGGSPLQNLIQNGHEQTVVSALRMVEELDAGPVYLKRPMALDGRAQEIYERLAEIVFELIAEIVATEPAPNPQEGDIVEFQRRIPDQSVLPKEGDIKRLHDHIRMLDAESYPRAFLDHGGHRLEFSHARMKNGTVEANVKITKRT